MKTNRGKIQGRDAKTQATDGRPIYLRMAESMKQKKRAPELMAPLRSSIKCSPKFCLSASTR